MNASVLGGALRAGPILVILGVFLAVAGASAGESDRFRPKAARDGSFSLTADRAELRGEGLRCLETPDGPRIVDWTSPKDHIRWEFDLPRSGRYLVVVEYAAPMGQGGALFELEVAEQVRQARVHATGSTRQLLPQLLKDPVELEAGAQVLEIRAREVPHGLVMVLARARLIPTEDTPFPD